MSKHKQSRHVLWDEDELRCARMPWAWKLYPDKYSVFVWEPWSPFAMSVHGEIVYPWIVAQRRKLWAWRQRSKEFNHKARSLDKS